MARCGQMCKDENEKDKDKDKDKDYDRYIVLRPFK